MSTPKLFSPVTDADLERARRDLAFRQKLLAESPDTLLDKLQRLRAAPAAGHLGPSAKAQSSPSASPK